MMSESGLEFLVVGAAAIIAITDALISKMGQMSK